MTTLHCVLCLYVRTGRAPEAVTVIHGMACCDTHLGYFTGGTTLAQAIQLWRDQHRDGGP